ncbi:copper amine oxidase N-terminal domain-containing protein [Paenibacillus bouchesdurhonensis]|uniref:copper amine oxidase N-terminal domain-containing protein n=1 Tax=Paenibacillus bouchesdurhonensis TaxID=1870990 RepID=UPI000DA6083A|nr:copper amine oxidase N-terminal domain-containing protein [Paenibacillus bouchesdurhonensis]
MKNFKSKYYILFVVLAMLTGVFAWPQGNLQAANASDSFIQEINKQYTTIRDEFRGQYESDLKQIQGDFEQFLQKSREDQSTLEKLLDDDLAYLTQLLKEDHKQLQAAYGKQSGYQSKLQKYERAINPHYSSGPLWRYNKESDKSYSSSIHWKFNNEINPNYSSSLMWKYSNNVNPSYSSSIMWKYANTMNPNYSSSLMWKLDNESNPSYSSSTMWNYARGGISLTTAKDKMATIFANARKDLQASRDQSVGEMNKLKANTESSIIALRNSSAEKLLQQRASSLAEISSIRERNFGKGITPNKLQISFDKIRVIIDGEVMAFEQPPVMRNGSTLVPMRAIFERLGATLKWNAQTQSVVATKDDTRIELTLGSKAAKKNGQVINLDVPGQLVGSHTMVPIRFISESLGASVKWDSATQTVYITTTAAESGDIMPSETEEAVPGTGSDSTTIE